MTITKTALLQQTARDCQAITEEVRTPVEVFLHHISEALAAGKSVNLKHFGVFLPDGRFKPAPAMVQRIADGPRPIQGNRSPLRSADPVTVDDLEALEQRLLQRLGFISQPASS